MGTGITSRSKRVYTKDLQKGGGPVVSHPSLRGDSILARVTGFDPKRGTYQVVPEGDPSSPYAKGASSPLQVELKTSSELTTAPLLIGTQVLLDCKVSPACIRGILLRDTIPLTAAEGVGTSILPDTMLTTSFASPKGFNCRSKYAPVDALPGDWITVGPDGNRVGVLLGGYSVLGSGPGAKSRFETHQIIDLARVVTENYEVFTGFGDLKVHNKGGRCGLSFRAAADQKNEVGGGEEQWTFKLDIGDSGQFFTMEVCDPDGATKAKVNITAGGEVTVLSTNGLSIVDGSKGTSSFEFASSLVTKVLQEMREIVTGNVEQTYASDRTTRVSGSDSRTVNNDIENVTGNQTSSVSGSVQQTVYGGSFAAAKPTNVAMETQVHNGSYILEVGNPKAGANPAALAGISLVSHNGAVIIGSHPPGPNMSTPQLTVGINTNSVPESIGLGLPVEQCVDTVVKAMPLEDLLTMMATIFDVHVHPPPGTSPPVPAMSMSPSVVPMLELIRSRVVKISL